MTTPSLDELLKIADEAVGTKAADGGIWVYSNAYPVFRDAFNPTVAKALVMGMMVLAEAAQAMHGVGPLSRVDPSDTLDEIGMKAEAALSALTLALKGIPHG